MSRVRSSLVLAMVVVMGAALVAAAAEQGSRPGGASSRRGFGFFGRSSSLTGLLSSEQVQKELKLNDEQKSKVAEISKKIRADMSKEYAALREMTDRTKQRAKMTELSEQRDQMARKALRGVLEREQVVRLYQIRMQTRGVVDSLGNEFVARRLKLTDEQKKKVAAIDKSAQEKRSKLSAGSRDASQEERRKRSTERRTIGQKADEEALAVLTAEQKEGFEKMQGEKFELQRRSRPQ